MTQINPLCPVCGATMYPLSCKLVCPRCGYSETCSDLLPPLGETS